MYRRSLEMIVFLYLRYMKIKYLYQMIWNLLHL
nr:MAG TPA_asm: hypothetical protein [Bacteriophage sp.]